MRIVFMGTPDFSVPVLEALVQEGHEVVQVVTQPDKPKGRGKSVLMTPVKEKALELGLKVLQPEKIKKDAAFFEQLKACHIILKGPTTTPQKGSGMPNIESANVAMRKALDLFANIRPVKVPEEGINWTIFRENTEGGYAVGSSGFNVTDDLAVDFTVTTKQGSDRIARLAYDYARKNGFTRVSLVTKANVIKTTDGNFLEDCHKVAALYPEITTDEWYADIMTAKLVDQKRRRDFQVLLLPNLYGDIISDEAAEFQGGVGTAGCANIGKKYAMFEAIHGSAPRMITEGRGKYADPSSMLRACVMLLSHIGLQDRADRLERALDICTFEEKALVITGRDTGATCEAFGEYVMETLRGL